MANSKEGFNLRRLASHHLFLPILALVLMMVINFILSPSFFSITINNGVLYGSLIDVMNRASELIILAIGMTLVTAASGGQDISVGAIMAVTAAVVTQILSGGEVSVSQYQNSIVLALGAGLLAGMLCGAFNGFLVAKMKIQPMVATLILYTAGRGIAQLITHGQITYIRVDAYKIPGNYISGIPIPTPIIISTVVAVIAFVILKKTALGLFIAGVGMNSSAARLVGLNKSRIKIIVFVINGFLAGIAGFIASSRIYSADANNIGLNIEMDAILAVALGGNLLSGGKFSLMGSIIGAYTIQALTTTLYSLNVSADRLPVYKAIVVLAIVIAQSDTVQKSVKQLFANYKKTLTKVQGEV